MRDFCVSKKITSKKGKKYKVNITYLEDGVNWNYMFTIYKFPYTIFNIVERLFYWTGDFRNKDINELVIKLIDEYEEDNKYPDNVQRFLDK